jgi:hypothetical protein
MNPITASNCLAIGKCSVTCKYLVTSRCLVRGSQLFDFSFGGGVSPFGSGARFWTFSEASRDVVGVRSIAGQARRIYPSDTLRMEGRKPAMTLHTKLHRCVSRRRLQSIDYCPILMTYNELLAGKVTACERSNDVGSVLV